MHIRYCEACNQETEHKEAARAPRTTRFASAPREQANEAQAYPARPKSYIICQECGNETLDNEEGVFR